VANSHADDFPYIGSILALSNSASRSFDVSSFAGTQLFAEFGVAAADDHAAENLCNSRFLVFVFGSSPCLFTCLLYAGTQLSVGADGAVVVDHAASNSCIGVFIACLLHTSLSCAC